MRKATMIQELANVGMMIYGERKMKKEKVEALYKARFTQSAHETKETKKEEKNMTTKTVQETEEKTMTKAETRAQERDAHIDLVLDTVGQALLGNAEADVYPNLGDWIKIKLGGKTILEARFGKKDLRVQAAEDVAKEAGVTYKLVMSFSKPATMFLQYDADGMSQLDALIGAADTVAAEKQAEKEAKEMEKMLAKETAKAEKAAARAAKKAAKQATTEADKEKEPKAE